MNKPKILITEDDRDNQRFLQIFLSKNFDVIICDQASSFYDEMKKSKVDLIIMDISLRGNKNGLDIIKEIKSIDEYSKIPVICLTAHAFPKDKENAITAGADLYLTKPVFNDILMTSIIQLLVKNVNAPI